MMLCQRVKPRLVSFIRRDIQNLVWFPNLLAVIVPLLGTNFDFLKLKVASSNVQRRKLALLLQCMHNLASCTVEFVLVMQIVSHKAFVVIVNGRIRKVGKGVKVI